MKKFTEYFEIIDAAEKKGRTFSKRKMLMHFLKNFEPLSPLEVEILNSPCGSEGEHSRTILLKKLEIEHEISRYNYPKRAIYFFMFVSGSQIIDKFNIDGTMEYLSQIGVYEQDVIDAFNEAIIFEGS